MTPLFVAFRRTLPSGAVVMITLERDDAQGGVRGIMQLERRTETARREGHTAPVLAEVFGSSQNEVMDQLREIAEHDSGLVERLARWQAARRGSTPRASPAVDPPADPPADPPTRA